MSEFGIKPPAKAGWDVAGKHHQPVTHTWQPETNKHHLALFFGCMVRKMEEENTWPNLPRLCSQGDGHSQMSRQCARCRTLQFSFSPRLTPTCITQPLGMIFCSTPYCRPRISGHPACPYLICFLPTL